MACAECQLPEVPLQREGGGAPAGPPGCSGDCVAGKWWLVALESGSTRAVNEKPELAAGSLSSGKGFLILRHALALSVLSVSCRVTPCTFPSVHARGVARLCKGCFFRPGGRAALSQPGTLGPVESSSG